MPRLILERHSGEAFLIFTPEGQSIRITAKDHYRIQIEAPIEFQIVREECLDSQSRGGTRNTQQTLTALPNSCQTPND